MALFVRLGLSVGFKELCLGYFISVFVFVLLGPGAQLSSLLVRFLFLF